MDDELAPVALTHREQVILAALLRHIVRADGRLSEEEFDALADLPRQLELADAQWEALWTEAQRTYPNAESAKEAALCVDRVEAREWLYEHLYRLAEADDIDDAEWDVLEWLSEAWRARYG